MSFCFSQVKVTQELKNTHTEQMTRLHFKHQTECDLLEDMRYEHICVTRMHISLPLPGIHCSVKWTLPLTKGNSLGVQEGWHGKEKREEEEEYCHITVLGEGQRVWKITKEFPAALFLLSVPASFFHFSEFHAVSLSAFTYPSVSFLFSVSISLFLVLTQLLFTHDVRESGSSPSWIWRWEGTLVPSQALIFCVD